MLLRIIFALGFLNLSACSYFQRRNPPATPITTSATTAPAPTSMTPKVPASPTAPSTTPSANEDSAQVREMKEAVAQAAEHLQASHHQHTREAGPVPAEKSLGWLQNGNTRFVRGTFRKDGVSAKDRQRLATGQKPHAVILSCSDSRVPPEVLFDQKLGEIFVVRTAGEALDHNVLGSIEYAVEHLGSNLVVVMGHESCGAVKATLSALSGADLGSPNLLGLVNDLKPRLTKFKGTAASAQLVDESWANVDGVARDLLLRSEILRDAVTSGEVKIVRAMYHLESGKVEFK